MKQLLLSMFGGLLLTQCAQAQFVDDFADGNFHQNPAWLGDSTLFVVNEEGQLQQNAQGATRTQLRTASRAIDQASWEWWMRLDFNPSSSNYADVYLLSNQPDFEGLLEGYFVRIGNTTDEVSLYRQTGNTRTKIIDGVDGLLNRNNNLLRVKVTRDTHGNWALWSDSTGSGLHHRLEGTAFDVQVTEGQWFGLSHVFTASRANGFFYDNFVVTGQPIPDTISPQIAAATLTEQLIRLEFSKDLPLDTLLRHQNYELTGFGMPLRVQTPNPRTVLLEWAVNFPDPAWLELDVRLADSSENLLDTTLRLLNRSILPGDVVINEVLPIQSPVVGLPETEFVELHNTTLFPICIGGWRYGDLQSSVVLPELCLAPEEFLILCPRNSLPLWESWGRAVEIHPWPSLNNEQDELFLRTPEGLLVDTLFYQRSWLGDAVKQAGGWSLERTNTNIRCFHSAYWQASTHDAGGTPGSINSRFNQTSVMPRPQLWWAHRSENDSLVLRFSEPVGGGILRMASGHVIQLDSTIRQLEWRLINPQGDGNDSIVHFEMSGFADCAGQEAGFLKLELWKPERAEAGQLLFNEVYFRPRSEGSSYFEIHNTGSWAVNLAHLRVGAADAHWQPTQSIPLFGYLQPGKRRVFTLDTAALTSDFGTVPALHRMQMQTWPTLNQSGGRLLLMRNNGEVLDRLLFHDSLHHALLTDTRGVALERTEGMKNSVSWGSAQSVVRGTPGKENSRRVVPSTEPLNFEVKPEVLRPGRMEYAYIRLKTTENCLVYLRLRDLAGRKLADLFAPALVSGYFEQQWDGRLPNGQHLPTGAYLLELECVQPDGLTKRSLRRVVVSHLNP